MNVKYNQYAMDNNVAEIEIHKKIFLIMMILSVCALLKVAAFTYNF